MQVNHALDGLLDLLAEATVRRLEKQNPAIGAGSCNEPLSAKECVNDERLPNETNRPQANS